MDSKLTSPNHGKCVNYVHWGILLFIALPVSHLIVTESQPKPMWVLIWQSNYHVAMAFSWPFTFLLMFWIHYCTKKLDIFAPWTANWVKRVCLQFLLGVLLVLVVDVLVVKAYFSVLGGNFEKSGYMQIEFPIIRWMVLFLNSFYIAWFFSAKYFETREINYSLNKNITLLNNEKKKASQYAHKIEAKLGNKVFIVEVGDVAYFEREHNVGYVYLLNEKRLNIDHTLNKLSSMLDPALFCQISRSIMVSFLAMARYNKVKNMQAEIVFKDDFKSDVPIIVSRESMHNFKERFDQFVENYHSPS